MTITAMILSLFACTTAPQGLSVAPGAFATGAVHYPARQKTQLHSGWFDAASNRTLIAYPAGENDSGQSTSSPTIITFDHGTDAWSEPHEIFASPVEPDAHNYPQILVGDDGKLHVLHTFHGNHAIVHSVSDGDITQWESVDIPDTDGATYGAGFKGDNGDFYLFFRHRDNLGGEPNYEPEYCIKSTDSGETWTKHKIIDPLLDYRAGDNPWGTVYTKSMHYVDSPSEGLHIVFAVHKDHNLFLDRHHYAFFRFSDGHLLTAGGDDLGTTLDPDELDVTLLFEHGSATAFYNIRTAVDVNEAGLPTVFYNQTVNGVDSLKRQRWDGQNWQHTDVGLERVAPFEVLVTSTGATLYAIERARQIKRYEFRGDALSDDTTLFEIEANDYRLAHLTFVQNGTSELRGFFFYGAFGPWNTPTPTGSLVSFRE